MLNKNYNFIIPAASKQGEGYSAEQVIFYFSIDVTKAVIKWVAILILC